MSGAVAAQVRCLVCGSILMKGLPGGELSCRGNYVYGF